MSNARSSTVDTIINELLIRIANSDDLDEVSTQIEELLAITHRLLDRNPGANSGDIIGDTSEYVAWLDNYYASGGGSRGGATPTPAARSAIEALETFEVGSPETMMNKDCVVCRDAMVMGEIGKKLPCGHCYHGDCILSWLATSNSCPLCRFQLQTDDPDSPV